MDRRVQMGRTTFETIKVQVLLKNLPFFLKLVSDISKKDHALSIRSLRAA